MSKQDNFLEEKFLMRKAFHLYEQITKDKLKSWVIHMQFTYGGNFLSDMNGPQLVEFAKEIGINIGEQNIKKKSF